MLLRRADRLFMNDRIKLSGDLPDQVVGEPRNDRSMGVVYVTLALRGTQPFFEDDLVELLNLP